MPNIRVREPGEDEEKPGSKALGRKSAAPPCPASRRSRLSPTTTSRSKTHFLGFFCQIQQKRALKAFPSTQTGADSDPHGPGPGAAAAGRAQGSQRRLPPPRLPAPLDGAAGNQGGGLPFWPCCIQTDSFTRCESRFAHGVEVFDLSTDARRKGYGS